jgi:TonB family protein
MPHLLRYCVVSALAIVQPVRAVEHGFHTLPFSGVAVGGVSGEGAWGHGQAILLVHGSASDDDNKIFKTTEGTVFLDAPRPRCPAPNRTVHGVVRLKLDRKSGHVLSVAVIQSTGQTVLDRAALEALKQWRTGPGAKLDSVDIAIVFVGRGPLHSGRE